MSSAPEIPLDLRERMQDCILALFWPKKKILEFLKDVGVPKELIPSNQEGLSRRDIVTQSFSNLIAQPDRGHGPFQEMLDQLSTWSYFDPYYFDELKKLDRGHAAKQIDTLRRSIDRRNATVQNRRTTAFAAQKQRSSSNDLATLKRAFEKTFGSDMTPQDR